MGEEERPLEENLHQETHLLLIERLPKSSELASPASSQSEAFNCRPPPPGGRISFELHDHVVHRERIARLDQKLLDLRIALGTQNVLHLHRLDHGKRVPRPDVLTARDVK